MRAEIEGYLEDLKRKVAMNKKILMQREQEKDGLVEEYTQVE